MAKGLGKRGGSQDRAKQQWAKRWLEHTTSRQGRFGDPRIDPANIDPPMGDRKSGPRFTLPATFATIWGRKEASDTPWQSCIFITRR